MNIIWSTTVSQAIIQMQKVAHNRLSATLVALPYNVRFRELESQCGPYASLCIQRHNCLCGNTLVKDICIIRCNPLQPLEMRRIIDAFSPVYIAFGYKIVRLAAPFETVTVNESNVLV
jgi:hypothetical protein